MTSTAGEGELVEGYDSPPSTDSNATEPEATDLETELRSQEEIEEEDGDEEGREESVEESDQDLESQAEVGDLDGTNERSQHVLDGQVQKDSTLLLETESERSKSEEISMDDGPDDSPSIQGSVDSNRSSSVAVSRSSYRSERSPATRPFEKRFQARVPTSPTVQRTKSPAFLTNHSRQSSTTSQLTIRSQESGGTTADGDDDHRPWDVVRWNKLKKLSQQAFSESGKRAFGKPTYLTVGISIAVGTSKGIILLFDYQQTLKSIIGQGTAAAECGSVTSLAISADHSTVAAGYVDGSIFTWDISKPAKPFLHIIPLPRSQIASRKQDGHVSDSAILHVGFLGQRRTALVSADNGGMAFSHLATRGFGAVARTVKTTRILGRYPEASKVAEAARKPSSVLAFAPLPLGNVEQFTDDFGLTALLTPYLLVIVSTTPVAQTQYKSPRPKDIASHGAMTGCLAWFPSVRLKDAESKGTDGLSRTKLLYSWSNMLYILEVEEARTDQPPDPDKRPEIAFKSRGQWKSEEAILAVQWLSRSIIAVLTITQRLLIIEDPSLRVADSSDLNSKHIYHQDLFSHQLQPLVDKIGHGDGSLHGIVPDAYHMSFKAYKGRLFLLGQSDVSMGTLSNWADRLMAMMEAGDHIAAIQLATKYYIGDTDRVTIGLPNEDEKRHTIVQDKLLELLSASLQYVFGDDTDDEKDPQKLLQDFAEACFTACYSINNIPFLFDEVYEWYSNASRQDIFLYELEKYILDEKITLIPETVLKEMLIWFSSLDLGSRLEKVVCSIQTETIDIDDASTVCKQMGLYDGLIHIWNRALSDYVTPLIELMKLAQKSESMEEESEEYEQIYESSAKIYPYLAYTLTGRKYPEGSVLSDQEASRARTSLYGFILAGRSIRWPRPHGSLIVFDSQATQDVNYPYLRFLLLFDSFNFLRMLNEAFEDGFLDDVEDQFTNGDPDRIANGEDFETSIDRQRIVTILRQVVIVPDFDPEDIIYLDIFLARNLPKYPGKIRLNGSILRQILIELCHYPRQELKEECQLSVEYLLSIYHPTDLQELIPLFSKAGFSRILKSTYKNSKQYAKWIDVHFLDEDGRNSVFNNIVQCLRSGSTLSNRQVQEVKTVLNERAKDLANIDIHQTASVLCTYAPELSEGAYESLDENSSNRYYFLQTIFEPNRQTDRDKQHFHKSSDSIVEMHRENYIQLMCQYDREHVADYVSTLKSGDLRLSEALPVIENAGAIDAAVILLAQEDRASKAMERLLNHLVTLKSFLINLLDTQKHSPDASNTEEAINDILEGLQKYGKIGIWLCQGQSRSTDTSNIERKKQQRQKQTTSITDDDLNSGELLWVDLLEALVTISQTVMIPSLPEADTADLEQRSSSKTIDTLRSIVQQSFTTVLADSVSATASPSHSSGADQLASTSLSQTNVEKQNKTSLSSTVTQPNVSFILILTTLLTRLSSSTPKVAPDQKQSQTSLHPLLPTLEQIFSSFAFEESLLSIATTFLDKDVFVLVEELESKRRMGWRPKGQTCEVCKRRAWGNGAGVGVWEEWWRRRRKKEQGKIEKQNMTLSNEGKADGRKEDQNIENLKGKERAINGTGRVQEEEEEDTNREIPDSLILFSCSHLFHKKCLKSVAQISTNGDQADGKSEYRCPLCA